MKYIKTYESLEDNGPQVGDYVICRDKWITVEITTSVQDYHYINFLANNVGKLEYMNMGAGGTLHYFVTYENVPESVDKEYFVKGYTISISREEIIFWSKDSKECEAFIDAKKYNI